MFLHTFRQLIRANRWFYFPYAALLLMALCVQLTFTQFEISLFINGFHSAARDFIFRYLTDLGDGWFAVAVIITIFLFRKRHTLEVVLCFALTALTTQALKHLVFSDHLRPSVRMKHITGLHYVPGVDMHELNSFPSGHTTSAFAVFLFLALIASNKKLGILFLVMALLVGVSRIYLLQHFWEDVLAGSVIGVAGTTVIYAIFENKRAKR